MKKLCAFAFFAIMTAPAYAGVPVAVPEMDAGAGIAAIALLAGVAAVVREKMKK